MRRTSLVPHRAAGDGPRLCQGERRPRGAGCWSGRPCEAHSCSCYARSPPNTLLRVINPQVSRALGSSQAQLANQIGQQWDGMNLSKLSGSVSSFGYSGTIANVLLATSTRGFQPIIGVKPTYRRVEFPWASTTGDAAGGEALSRYGTCWVPAEPSLPASSEETVAWSSALLARTATRQASST